MKETRLGAGLAALVVLWLAAAPAGWSAVRVQGLYEAQVRVQDQSGEQREPALRQALERVLVRVTGAQSMAQLPAVTEAVSRAGDFVQQYRYRTETVEAVTGSGPASEPQEELWLSVKFDPAAVRRVLTEAGLPLWGEERPVTLVWLAVETPERRYLMDAGTRNPVREALFDSADQRGIPLVLPLMDLEDQARIDFADVWGGFTESIQAASRRYDSDAQLIGRLRQGRGGLWHGRWSLNEDGREGHWTSRGDDPQEVVAVGIDGAADTLASRYAIGADARQASSATLEVLDVGSFEAFARVEDYLGSRFLIRRHFLERLEGARLRYRLELQGSVAALEQMFALGDVLAPVAESQTAEAAGASRLQYRLLP